MSGANLSSRRGSQVDRRVFNLWRERFPEEYAEGWPVCVQLVNTCWRNLTPNSRHTTARAVFRSTMATEHPQEYVELRAQALADVLADPRYREKAAA